MRISRHNPRRSEITNAVAHAFKLRVGLAVERDQDGRLVVEWDFPDIRLVDKEAPRNLRFLTRAEAARSGLSPDELFPASYLPGAVRVA